MGPVGVYRLLFIHRIAVSACIQAVPAAAVFLLLLLSKLVQHALQVRVIRINARIHDTDRTARVFRRFLIAAPFSPSGNAEAVTAGGRKRRRIYIGCIRQIPLHC